MQISRVKLFTLPITAQKILIWTICVSVLLRVAAAIYMGNQVVELPGTADQISYHTLAQRVLNGYGFTFGIGWWPITRAGEPTAHWSFLYTFYLVGVYSLFGVNPIVARVIQAILVGILHPLLAYLLGKRIYNQKLGIIAAALTAGYIYFIYYSGALMTEPLYITGILGALYLCILPPGTPDTKSFLKRYIVLGLVLGAIILLRQLFLLVIPFLLLWLWYREVLVHKQNWMVSAARLTMPIIVIVLMILPFTIYNFSRFQRFVLLNTNAGYAFYFGNHPIYGTNFVGILPPEMGSYQRLIPEELQTLDEAALDQELLDRAVGIIIDDPVRYILLSISRIPVYFQFWPSPDSGTISNLSRVASFALLLPFMIYGIIRSARLHYLKSLTRPLVLLLLFALLYTGIHLLTWALIRYRLPVDAVLLVPASLGIFDLYHWIKSTYRPQTKYSTSR